MTDDAARATQIHLDRDSGLARPVTRIVAVWAVCGLVIAIVGIAGLAEGAEGGIQVLSWLLTALGLLAAIAATALLALGRRRGRPATLSAQGIVCPGRRESITWDRVEACVVRRLSGEQSVLFARFTSQYAKTTGSEGISLGRIPENDSGEEILRQIDSWRRAMDK